jgi:hypothetical protein
MMDSMNSGDVTGGRGRRGLDGLLLDGGVDGNEQVCPDPKDCPSPGVVTDAPPVISDAQVCPDPKDCPSPGTSPDAPAQ